MGPQWKPPVPLVIEDNLDAADSLRMAVTLDEGYGCGTGDSPGIGRPSP